MSDATHPWAILEPGNHPPREGERPVLDIRDLSQGQLLQFARPAGGLLFIDLETQGTRVWDLSRKVVGVALADDTGACYVHVGVEEEGQALWGYFLQQLYIERTSLIAHNVSYDAAWCSRDLALVLEEEGPMQGPGTRRQARMASLWDRPPPWHNWYACSLATYKHLASEAWLGQRHGLKQAQIEMLGWAESNEAELDAWLCDNGYGRWTTEKATGNKVAHPNKAEMWRAPPKVLGAYAGLDSESTYLLWNRILKPAWDLFDAYRKYHQEWLCGRLGLQHQLVWQKLRGVRIDTGKLGRLHAGLRARLVELDAEFRAHPQVAEHIAAYDAAKVAEVRATEPPRWKKLPVLGAEPPRTKKDGTASANWLKWRTKSEELQRVEASIQVAERGGESPAAALEWQSHHWTQWRLRLEEALSAKHFNPNSDEQLRWLFHDVLNFPVLIMTDHETNPVPSMNEDALKGFGPAGALLIQYAGLDKLKQSVESLQARLADGIDGQTYHPELRAPGTATGRLSGSGGFNWQNAPKCKEILECMVPRPGHKILACDIASLEQVVLAELSQDPQLMKLYGPNAKPNDVYLFVGASLPGRIGKAIRGAGYDPDNPTPEGIKAAKTQAKGERSISKAITLGCSYGMGAGKLREGLGQQGVEVSLGEAKSLVAGYWALFDGVRRYGRWLEAMWERNGGWVLNGIGRPVCCAEDYKRDLVNRVVQSCGHDCFMLFIYLMAHEFERAGIAFKPFNADLHDATYVEVPDEQVAQAKHIIDNVIPKQAKAILGGGVALKWDANVCSCVFDDKPESASVTEQGVRV